MFLNAFLLISVQYIGLQILEKVITTRWKSLPDGQRQGTRAFLFQRVLEYNKIYPGIRNFVVGVTVKVASDETTLRKEKTYINKLNLALVQVRASNLFSIFSSDVHHRYSSKNGRITGRRLYLNWSSPRKPIFLCARTTWLFFDSYQKKFLISLPRI